MSRLDELIQEYCPDGVEYRKIQDIGVLLKGMSGVSNKWAETGNCKFIDYKNVYDHLKVDIFDTPYATVKSTKNQTILNTGDILFTSASETPDECAVSAVIEGAIASNILMDDHLFGIRFNSNILNSTYVNYYCRSSEFRKKVNKTVRGVTRYYISIPNFLNITIPVPPLPVQKKIVRILDSFTELTAELQAELQARKKQYEFYRDFLLHGKNNVRTVKLRDIASYSKERIHAIEVDETTYVGVDNLLQNKQGKTIATYIPKEGTLTKFQPHDILIGNIRPYLRKIWYSNSTGGTNGDVLTIRLNKESNILSRYLYYVLSDERFFIYDTNNSKGAKMPRGNKEAVMDYEVVVRSLEEQQRIVSILDRFDTLCNDISSGLPAEIEARQKQYEYYRDKLLTFKRLDGDE